MGHPGIACLGKQSRYCVGLPPRDADGGTTSPRESPAAAVILLPSSATNAAASIPHAPSVSKASGTNTGDCQALYFRVLAASARAAADPACVADDAGRVRWGEGVRGRDVPGSGPHSGLVTRGSARPRRDASRLTC